MKKLNLQFFADEEIESVDTQEVAEPVQSQEDNARFAAARRKAEETERRKYEQELRKIDQRYSTLFSNYVNPQTGKPISSALEYAEVVEMQNRLAVENQLKQNGVDPSVIQQFIANDPTVRAAQAVIEQQKAAETDMRISNDIQAISKIDPSIKSVDDLAKDENFTEIYERWQKSNMTESLYDIYRLVNFDKLTAKKADAAKQAAINQAKGKSHLETTTGMTVSNEMVEVPANVLVKLRGFYPNCTDAQIKKKYNDSL